MQNQYSRTQLLLGAEAMEKLHNSRVAVFGIGGVGGYTVEALARSGVGALDLIDDDKVCLTNLNRQIIATRSTVGQYKVDVAAQRIHDIDPDIRVTTHRCFFGPETQDQFDFTQYDYVVDAIDTVTGKLALVMKCKEVGTPIICSMGAGNKMDPTRFEVTDIYKTSVCPLAKVMRTECRKRRIKHLKVVYSKEPAMTPIEDDDISCKYHCICPPGTQRKCTQRRSVPGSNAFVPSVAGLIIGGEVVKDLVGFVLDFVLRGVLPKSLRGGYTGHADEVDCHEEHSDEEGKPAPIWKAALRHTLEIFVFIFAFSLVFGLIVEGVGEDVFADLLGSMGFFQPVVAALVGLIPNCAASVLLTQLYVEGALRFSSLVAGLCTGAGVGLAVLWRTNPSWKQNLFITGLTWGAGAFLGVAMQVVVAVFA